MKQAVYMMVLLVGTLFIFVPAPAAAQGIVPCGKNSGTAEEMKPCTLCHVVLGAQRLMQWGMNVMSVIAITVIFAMGVLYIVSTGNTGLMQTAKSGIWAALIGFAVMLSAWLIVNIVLTVLVNKSSQLFSGSGLVEAPGVFNFSCDTQSNVNGQ